ncbi:MAG: hypothetical protein ACK6DZ_00340 [Acidobacteriota bacterium]
MAHKIVDDAIVRYQKILESVPYNNLEWTDALTEKMKSHGMVVGVRLASPFLRPHFLTKKQFELLTKNGQLLHSAIDLLESLALTQPALLQRWELLPAERMLAGIHPGYPFPHVSCLMNAVIEQTSPRIRGMQSTSAAGLAYGEMLSDMFFDAGPVREFRKKQALTKLGGTKLLLSALLKAYKAYGGKRQPQMAILEFKQPFQTIDSAEYLVLCELFRKHGYQTELVNPEQLDYRNGALSKGDYRIDLLFRAASLQEFLLRFDLSHPLVKAYREGKVCMVNSFRAELAQKPTMFCLLTDEVITASFPLAERKAIAAMVPWTRTVAAGRTQRGPEQIDLPEYISAHKDELILLPNDSTGTLPVYDGPSTEQSAWDRAIKQALRERYVVQQRIRPETSRFPVLFYGSMDYRDMQVQVHPHAMLGEVKTATAHLSSAEGGFSTMQGAAPLYLLDTK